MRFGTGRAALPARDGDDDEVSAQAGMTNGLREVAHRYLEDGLLPVPAWAARQDGGCCCWKGADCPRPGKHPRAVRTGPGPHDWSWKPLTCRTHAESFTWAECARQFRDTLRVIPRSTWQPLKNRVVPNAAA